MKRRAITAGNVGVDISPIFTGEGWTSIGQVFRPGEIVHIEGSEIHPGGGAANTGIAMNFFGVETTVMARMGDDALGKMLLQMMADYETPTAFISDCDSYTAYSVILAVPGFDRIILQNPGANDRFHSGDIDKEIVRKSHLFHFGHPPSMERIYEEDGREMVTIFRSMKEAGLVTSLDLCAVDPASPAAKQDWRRFLENVLPYVDFFLPSKSELSYMLGDCTADVENLANQSRQMGAGSVVIKMGEKGMFYSTGDKDTIEGIEKKLEFKKGTLDSWIDRSGWVEPYPIEKEVSGLGAGDTSIAALLSALLQGYSFETSLYLAAAEGALCVTAYDAFSGLVPFEELL